MTDKITTCPNCGRIDCGEFGGCGPGAEWRKRPAPDVAALVLTDEERRALLERLGPRREIDR